MDAQMTAIAEPQLFFASQAAAYVRGKLARRPAADRAPALFSAPLDALDEASLGSLIGLGQEEGLRLQRFKRSMGLPLE